MIELRILGAVDLRAADAGDFPAILTRPKLLALLAYLILARPNGFRSRDTLVCMFWPESDDKRARGALNQALYELRKALGPDVIVSRGTDEVGVDRHRVWCDAQAFDEALSAGEWHRALPLYQGELLPGFHLSGCGQFADWLDERRQALRQDALNAVRRWSESLVAAADSVEAVYWLRQALRWAPFDEDILRRLLGLLGELGDRTGALREYQSFARRLQAELGTEPEAETRALLGRIESERTSTSRPVHSFADRDATPGPALPQQNVGVLKNRRLALVAAVIAVAAMATMLLRAPGATNEQIDNRRVVVATVENRTGDPELEPLGRMASSWLASELLTTGLVQVVPPTAVMEKVRRLGARGVRGHDLLVSIGADTHAGLLVYGAFFRHGDTLIFQLHVLDVQTNRLARAVRASGPAKDPLAVIERLGRRTTGALATLIDDRLSQWAHAASQPPSYESYRTYSDGLDLFSRREFARAAKAFSDAAAADASFTAPVLWEALCYHSLMYRNNVMLAYDQGARSDSLLAQLGERRQQLPLWDRAALDWLTAERSGDRSTAHRALRRIVALGPDPRFQLALASTAYARNYTDEALAALAEVTADEARAHGMSGLRRTILLGAYHRRGDYERELAIVDEQRRQDPTFVWEKIALRAYAGLGRRGLVDSLMTILLERDALATAPVLRELEIHGFGELVRAANETILAKHKEVPPARRDEEWRQREADLLLALGRPAEAADRIGTMLAESPRSDNVVWYLGDLGRLAAMQGDVAVATQYLRKLESIDLAPIFTVDIEAVVAYQRAQILAALGRRNEAIEVLRQAVVEETAVFYHPHFQLLFPEFDALVGDPGYERLVASRG